MDNINKTDLLINLDGSIYHLKLLPSEIASTVFLVGDPDRVPMVSKYFDSIEIERQSREFITHTGMKNGKKVSVVSTGIGTDNIDIVMHELDALHNIDFKQYKVKDKITSLEIIRIGTSGAIQPDIAVGSFLVSSMAAGFDALGLFYKAPQSEHCIDHSNELSYKLAPLVDAGIKPYSCKASNEMLKKVPPGFLYGITVTMPGFYAPQGRRLRGGSRIEKDLIGFLQHQVYENQKISNLEMETAGIYLLATVLGHQAISYNAILANRVNDEFSGEPEKIVDEMIRQVIDIHTR
jgi:uridine phosphorylase